MIRQIFAFCLLGTPALAAGSTDPDWPCVQRRQPAMSVAQIWPGPPIPAGISSRTSDPEIAALSRQLALRRLSLDEAGGLIREFAIDHPAEDLMALFLATFEHIQSSRDRVMSGITRYAHKQASLDERINQQRRSFDALMNTVPKDFDAMDKAEAELDWSTRIFLDRQQSLTYVCETPVILEQRAFALARTFAAELKRMK